MSLLLRLSSRCFALPPAAQLLAVRQLYDRANVPRPVFDRRIRQKRVHNFGYKWNMYVPGQPLPRLKDSMNPVRGREFKIPDKWSKEAALFGQNDYIDLLGDGQVHPAQLLYHVPRWLRGFPGQHKANELIKLIHYRNLYYERLRKHAPKKWHELVKRINWLLSYCNYQKADEIRTFERQLPIWDSEPDYFYREKHYEKWFKDFKDNYY